MRCYCCCLHHIREEMFNWWWWWLSNENGWEKTNHHTRRPGASATCHRHKTMTTFNVHAIAQMRIDRFRSISPIRVRVRNVHPRERERERETIKCQVGHRRQVSIYLSYPQWDSIEPFFGCRLKFVPNWIVDRFGSLSSLVLLDIVPWSNKRVTIFLPYLKQ